MEAYVLGDALYTLACKPPPPRPRAAALLHVEHIFACLIIKPSARACHTVHRTWICPSLKPQSGFITVQFAVLHMIPMVTTMVGFFLCCVIPPSNQLLSTAGTAFTILPCRVFRFIRALPCVRLIPIHPLTHSLERAALFKLFPVHLVWGGSMDKPCPTV